MDFPRYLILDPCSYSLRLSHHLAIQGEVLATLKLGSLAADLFSRSPNVLVAMNFFFPCGLREMLEFKGFDGLSIIFDKKSFKLLAFFAGNLSAMP